MKSLEINLHESWKVALSDEIEKPYFKTLIKKLGKEYIKKTIYPPIDKIFNAFNVTLFNEVRVVIIGQDPYHGPNQANGLCFSVAEGIKLPPSLKNIYKELENDLGVPRPSHGNLISWAQQGVFLLNASLTVEDGKPASHAHLNWEEFTNALIKMLSMQKKGLVFLLWGNYAKEKEQFIDSSKHYILKAAHPSPFSAFNGFFGCKHFSQTNRILEAQSLNPIDWHIK